MQPWTDLVLITIMLSNLALTGLGMLGTCVRLTALQGALLGLVTIGFHGEELSLHVVALVTGTVTLKGFVFPRLLFRALREANVKREVEPFIGLGASLLIGTLTLPAAMLLTRLLPVGDRPGGAMAVPVAFHAILVGLFLIVSRRKAVTQVVGYVVMENGIFIFGVSLVRQMTFLIDLGVLLDIFVAVFVMGIAIFHISREFDHIDTDRLSTLRD